MQLYTFVVDQLRDLYSENEARALARIVISELYNLNMTDLYLDKDKAFSWEHDEQLRNIIKRLRMFEPVQYILENAPFAGLNFRVVQGVLIPRPETAELVEWMLSECCSDWSGRFLDVGTGTGCIPIAFSKRRPGASVKAVDVSEKALEIANLNNKLLGTDVSFKRQDILLEEIDGIYDIIVSNPPYICPSEKKQMDANVLEWEPDLALFVPEDDPLLFYRRIAIQGRSHLSFAGKLYFEINQAYGDEMIGMLQSMGYRDVQLKKDFYGKNRMIRAIR